MGFQLNRSSKAPMSEINVTPFVDVMLVLLIIFMVTAPLLTVGVQVDLPESAADSLPDDQEPLTITINSKGEVYIQEHKVNYQKIVNHNGFYYIFSNHSIKGAVSASYNSSRLAIASGVSSSRPRLIIR